MLATTTISGVVIHKISGWLTLLLKTGKKEKIKVIETDLKVGDKVLVAFNCHTSNIIAIYSELEIMLDETFYIPYEKQEYPIEDEFYNN